MWRSHGDATMRRSTRTTRAILPSNSRVTFRTDLRWSRPENLHRQRTRSNRLPPEVKRTHTRRHRAKASADRPDALSSPAVKCHERFGSVCMQQNGSEQTLYTARFVFVFKTNVPNELIPINPLGPLSRISAKTKHSSKMASSCIYGSVGLPKRAARSRNNKSHLCWSGTVCDFDSLIGPGLT
jgi:hypothetical protein